MFKKVLFTLALTFFSVSIYAQECLVIGHEIDPIKGRRLFKEAMQDWHKGLKTKALELYEQALIADSSVLRHEDHGMAKSLLDHYRNDTASKTVGDLCRRAFFENILGGNLDSSIDLYEKASEITDDKTHTQIALDEAERLKKEKDYIDNWQSEIKRKLAIQRKQDVQEYILTSEKKELSSEVEDNSQEIEELQERLAYLEKQEKETNEIVFDSVRKASRYRRRYYYPSSSYGNSPDPDANNFPSGNWGADGSMPSSQVADPYQSTANSEARKTSLYRFYTYRNKTNRSKTQLEQIRNEIAGLNKRIAQLKKQNKDLIIQKKELDGLKVK